MTSPLRRLPLASQQPVVAFALARLAITVLAFAIVAALGFPFEGRLSIVLLAIAVPWGLFNFLLARRSPETALNPLIAAGDLVMLGAVETVVPETYGAIRFIALAFLAVHAHLQGERIGVLVALFSTIALVLPTAIHDGGGGVKGSQLIFYDAVFVGAALMTVALVGRFRTEESASRMRARSVTHRTLQDENDIRRRVSESLHDGPVQDLIGLDMTLAAVDQYVARGDLEALEPLMAEARSIVSRNIQMLRDEMLELGPYAYEELSYESAIERLQPVWKRRFGIDVRLDLAHLHLASDVEGELFRITQEAVTNAGKHGDAETVHISLRASGDELELAVIDDGHGLRGVDPLAATEPGHIGVASMRERTEMLGGELTIDSTAAGTSVRVRSPLLAPNGEVPT
jgi:two-component system NarL family sensor kinase